MLLETIKGEKSSGFPHLSRKRDVFESDLELAKEFVFGKGTVYPSICYHRTQKQSKSGSKTRLVCVYPQSFTFIEACFARSLINKFN